MRKFNEDAFQYYLPLFKREIGAAYTTNMPLYIEYLKAKLAEEQIRYTQDLIEATANLWKDKKSDDKAQ